MEPSPDFGFPLGQPAQFAILPSPTLLRNVGFWLLALGLGIILLFVVAMCFDASVSRGEHNSGSGELVALVAGIAAAVSLPALLLLLLPLLPWAVGSATTGLRWLRAGTLQSASLGLILSLIHGLGIFHGYESVILPVATIYFGGGLLAALAVYRRWLWPQYDLA